jgi:radical SAM superfamily enzyme YgiQ (UPF0313 family)
MNQKILFTLMPFWPPLIPPVGLGCLKGFLQSRGYDITTIDTNVLEEFRRTYDNYFHLLKDQVPEGKQGNFYNLGIDVLQNHMTAHFKKSEAAEGRGPDERVYRDLLKQLVYENFFCAVEDSLAEQLDREVAAFYARFDDYLKELWRTHAPDVFGVSVYKGNFGASLYALKRAKELYPDMLTVMGGGIFSDQLAIGSANFKYFNTHTPYIDKVIAGEGELLLLKLLRGELPGAQKVFTRLDMKEEVLDLSSAPLPDFSGFDMSFYAQMASYTSRSCPFQCGFCAETVNWGRFRKKDAARVAAELKELYRRHGQQLFLMSDSLLNPVITGLANELTTSETMFYWDGYLRADRHVCDIDNTYLWRRGGFYRARLGIESGSPRVLELMDKRITPDQVKTALANLAEAGIKTSTYWVIGYPGETEEDFQHTLDLLSEMKEFIYEAECNPFRFYLSGQVQSEQWSGKYRHVPLYPESADELLMIRTWMIEDGQLPRREIYRRVNRFTAHCGQLGIPNPYSWGGIYQADKRWKTLHANAAPMLVEFRDADVPIDECRSVRKPAAAQRVLRHSNDFHF